MVGKLLLRGLLAGLIAAVIAFGFAFVFGEPTVDAAIAFEEQMAADAAEPGDEAPPAISRDVQKSIGLFTGIAIVGVGLGGLFGVLFGLAHGRMGRLTGAQTALLLAAICFVTIVLAPWLKYPASPPASTLDDTIGFRTTLYFLMLALSIALTVCAWLIRAQLAPRLGGWNASVLAAVGYVVALLLLGALMPTVNEVPRGFPAAVMWDFRLASLGLQAVLWAAIGLVFGVLVDRTLPEQRAPRMAGAH